MEERTLVLIKPDGLYKSLTGNILTTFSEARLKIVAAKVVKVSRDLAEQHYGRLRSELITKFGLPDGYSRETRKETVKALYEKAAAKQRKVNGHFFMQ